MKVLVDSNVVLRAAQGGHSQYPVARAALAACQRKCAHDTRLLAGMMLHGVDHLLTFNDADFRRYPGLTVLVPHDVGGSSTAQKSSG